MAGPSVPHPTLRLSLVSRMTGISVVSPVVATFACWLATKSMSCKLASSTPPDTRFNSSKQCHCWKPATLSRCSVAKKGGKDKKSGGELDLEGVCYSMEEKVFYATGYHGVGKRRGDFERNRFNVFRIPSNAETGTLEEDQIVPYDGLPQGSPTRFQIQRPATTKPGRRQEAVAQ